MDVSGDVWEMKMKNGGGEGVKRGMGAWRCVEIKGV